MISAISKNFETVPLSTKVIIILWAGMMRFASQQFFVSKDAA